jgi:potassium-dependent mechanosensitive channel
MQRLSGRMTTLHPTRLHRSLLSVALALAALLAATVASAQAPSSPPRPDAAVQAQPALPPDISAAIAKMAKALGDAEKALQHLTELEEELGNLRVDVESVLSESHQTAEQLRPQLAAVRLQIERLGAPPAKDAPPEAPEMAQERARLLALAAALDGAIKTSELTWYRARQLIDKITVVRYSLFTKNLMERLPSPLLPGIWRDVFSESPAVAQRLKYMGGDWWKWASGKTHELALLLAAALLLYALIRFVVSRLTDRRALKAGAATPPSFFERAFSVVWVAPLRALPLIAAGMLVYGGLDALDLLYPPWSRAAAAILKALVAFAAVFALAGAVLAPTEPQWRLVNLADRPARRIVRLLGGIAAVYAADAALTEISRAFFVPLALSVVQSFAASTAFAGLLVGLLLTPFAPQGASPAAPVYRHAPRWLKLPLWIIAIAILALALLGYVALARFVAQQLVLTGIVVVLCWLGYLAIRALTREPPQRGYPVGEMLEARFGIDAARRNQLARLTEAALTLALIIAALPLLMLQWGFSGADIREWFKSLVFGLEVGQFRISLARILIGIVLFIALLFATRLFQRWLRETALQPPRFDPGIANSIDTVVGYAGTVVAAVLAISYAGFDITSLAIVAGALSVGIGFGLQSIVNNFVSGLILLVERPIKVGDWIVLGNDQGHVRRISVRSTEIETFDRASLIVPNSELITGRVLNWTHRNSVGRAILKVGVSYDADPDQVLALLKSCAEAHPQVLRTPEPRAVFENFGASALEFSLRVYLADISRSLEVQSELRVALLKAMRAAGIDIPFDQVDVNLRDLDLIKRLLAQVMDERPPQGSEETRAQPGGEGNGKRIAAKGS